MSHESTPQPGKLRRKAAAWTAGLALFGGTVAEAGLLAQPAQAHAEISRTHEAKSPAEYLLELEGNINKLAFEAANAKGALRESTEDGGTDYNLFAPDKANPKVHDQLGVVFDDKGNVASIVINDAMDTKKAHNATGFNMIDPKHHSFSVLAVSNIAGDSAEKADTITLAAHNKLAYVTTSGANQFKKQAINYAQNQSVVQKQMEAFFKEAESFMTRHYTNPMPVLKKIAARSKQY